VSTDKPLADITRRSLLEALVREMPADQVEIWIAAIERSQPRKRPGAKK
jgi:hypothetical protein